MNLEGRVKKLEEKKGIAGAVDNTEENKIINELYAKMKASKEEALKKGILPEKNLFENKEAFAKRFKAFEEEMRNRVLNTPEKELTPGELIFKRKCLKELELQRFKDEVKTEIKTSADKKLLDTEKKLG
jgi:hypothetical protein